MHKPPVEHADDHQVALVHRQFNAGYATKHNILAHLVSDGIFFAFDKDLLH